VLRTGYCGVSFQRFEGLGDTRSRFDLRMPLLALDCHLGERPPKGRCRSLKIVSGIGGFKLVNKLGPHRLVNTKWLCRFLAKFID
jgi:hypothetical protein